MANDAGCSKEARAFSIQCTQAQNRCPRQLNGLVQVSASVPKLVERSANCYPREGISGFG